MHVVPALVVFTKCPEKKIFWLGQKDILTVSEKKWMFFWAPKLTERLDEKQKKKQLPARDCRLGIYVNVGMDRALEGMFCYFCRKRVEKCKYLGIIQN